MDPGVPLTLTIKVRFRRLWELKEE